MREPNPHRDDLCCQLVSEVLQLSGAARIRVFGSSMLPCVLPQDVLIIAREEFRNIKKADVVLFARNDRLFAHRVVRQELTGGMATLVTRGDSLDHHDAPVFPHQVLGRVTSIQRGVRHISPRATFLSRSVSILLGHIPLLKTGLLWLLCRTSFSGSTFARGVSANA